jgi:hypothetical protein
MKKKGKTKPIYAWVICDVIHPIPSCEYSILDLNRRHRPATLNTMTDAEVEPPHPVYVRY